MTDHFVARPVWLVVATALVGASAAVLAWLASGAVIASWIRDPLSTFVQPGVTIWWFALGGPFRSAPYSATGIAFAAATNALFWLLVVWLARAVVGAIRRRLASRSARRWRT